jgi:hypothetical protein
MAASWQGGRGALSHARGIFRAVLLSATFMRRIRGFCTSTGGAMKATWDIFCSVVDNYGDIGVTWRLARQLVAEHGWRCACGWMTCNAFAPMCPGADAAAQQWQQGVEVRHWPAAWLPVAPADVVIGAFACQLPAAYVEAMRARPAAAVAEPGLPQCRGLGGGLPWLAFAAGQRPAQGVFFPGFTEKPVACCARARCWRGVTRSSSARASCRAWRKPEPARG